MDNLDSFSQSFRELEPSDWFIYLSDIMNLLHFPASLAYQGTMNDYLPTEVVNSNLLTDEERESFGCCEAIASFRFHRPYTRINCFIVRMANQYYYDNYMVESYCRLFRKLFGRTTIVIASVADAFVMTGTEIYYSGNSKIIISDWFYPDMDYDIVERLANIDLAYSAARNSSELYMDYLWGIARPYMRMLSAESDRYYVSPYSDVVMLPEPPARVEVLSDMYLYEQLLRAQVNQFDWKEIYGSDYYCDCSYAYVRKVPILNQDRTLNQRYVEEINEAEDIGNTAITGYNIHDEICAASPVDDKELLLLLMEMEKEEEKAAVVKSKNISR